MMTRKQAPKPRNYEKRLQTSFHEYVRMLGLGFHPDTRGCDYVDADGKRIFTDAQAAHYDAVMERMTSIVPDIYATAMGIWEALGLIKSEQSR